MSDAPHVSVLMPVRDAAPWLGEAAASVLAQDGVSLELIAVDDGSTDAGASMLAELAASDERVRLHATLDGARGIANALSLGLAMARGRWVARVDADDLMLAGRLAMQAAALDREPELFGVTCRVAAFPGAELRDGMREYLEWQNSLLTPCEIARDRFIESTALHPTWMMRTEALRALGGWRDADWAEDWDLLLRAMEAGLPIRRLPDTLLQWRVHPQQATRNDARYSEASMMRARAHFLARHLAPIRNGRPLWVLGAGPVGKALIKALTLEGIVAAGLVDVDERKIGGIVRGNGHAWRVIAHSQLRDMSPRPFAISAIAGAQARARVRTELARWSWQETEDFVVAA